MRAKHLGMVLLVLALVGVMGFSALSFAGGWGGGMRGGGPGNCPRANAGPGFAGDLTDEEIAATQKERQAFAEQTRELRDRIYQKNLELRSELAKQSPDSRKAAEIQKELSAMEGEMDQKRLDNQLKLKKENPKLYGRGFGMGMGPGSGRGFGPGSGPGRGGPCTQ